MKDEVSVWQVIDSILETWAAWGSSYPREQNELLNADVMHVDLAMSLALHLLKVGERTGSNELKGAISNAVYALGEVCELRDLVAPGSRTLDADNIERKRSDLGFNREG